VARAALESKPETLGSQALLLQGRLQHAGHAGHAAPLGGRPVAPSLSVWLAAGHVRQVSARVAPSLSVCLAAGHVRQVSARVAPSLPVCLSVCLAAGHVRQVSARVAPRPSYGDGQDRSPEPGCEDGRRAPETPALWESRSGHPKPRLSARGEAPGAAPKASRRQQQAGSAGKCSVIA
jgi:hypothetical protein